MMLFYEGRRVYMNGKYPAVCIKGKNYHIHRLQWVKYHGEIPEGYVVHYKDENKLNWDIDNLELLSRADHVREHRDKVHRPGVKVTAKKGNLILHFKSIEEAANYCGTYTACIQNCFKGKQKQSKGWIFERVVK